MRMTMLALAIVIVVSVSFLASHEAIPLAAQESPLDACAAILATYAPVVGTDSHPTPLDVPLPPVREAWRDPAFGTCVVRVTDRFHDFGTPLTGLKNEYSRVQAYNADNTLMMARSAEGDWFCMTRRHWLQSSAWTRALPSTSRAGMPRIRTASRSASGMMRSLVICSLT
jgi:hypothetical protein